MDQDSAASAGSPPPLEAADERAVLLVTHSGRESAVAISRAVARGLASRGVAVRVPADEVADLTLDATDLPVQVWRPESGGCEIVVVVGGDGTILRAAEFAVAVDVPLLGVNLGHVGFLAEVESDAAADVVAAVVDRDYRVEERLAVDVRVLHGGKQQWRSFALNEASLEKTTRRQMIEVLLEINGHPLSRWGCDGVVVATPTGSTAYAWSVGGPVVWPGVSAMLVAPISAHALFARPLVVDPATTVALEVAVDSQEAVLTCDGRRETPVAPGSRVEVTALARPVRLARLHTADFTDRLVAKFHLPVDGWRGGGPR